MAEPWDELVKEAVVGLRGIFAAAVIAQTTAQAVPAGETGLFGMLLQAGCFGIVCFVVYWGATKLIPGLFAANKETIDKITTAAQEQQREANERHAQELAEMTATFTATVEKLTANSEASREVFKQEMKESRHAFAQQIAFERDEIRKRDERMIELLQQEHK